MNNNNIIRILANVLLLATLFLFSVAPRRASAQTVTLVSTSLHGWNGQRITIDTDVNAEPQDVVVTNCTANALEVATACDSAKSMVRKRVNITIKNSTIGHIFVNCSFGWDGDASSFTVDNVRGVRSITVGKNFGLSAGLYVRNTSQPDSFNTLTIRDVDCASNGCKIDIQGMGATTYRTLQRLMLERVNAHAIVIGRAGWEHCYLGWEQMWCSVYGTEQPKEIMLTDVSSDFIVFTNDHPVYPLHRLLRVTAVEALVFGSFDYEKKVYDHTAPGPKTPQNLQFVDVKAKEFRMTCDFTIDNVQIMKCLNATTVPPSGSGGTTPTATTSAGYKFLATIDATTLDVDVIYWPAECIDQNYPTFKNLWWGNYPRQQLTISNRGGSSCSLQDRNNISCGLNDFASNCVRQGCDANCWTLLNTPSPTLLALKTHSKTRALDLPTSETLTENHAVHLPTSKTHSKTRALDLPTSETLTENHAVHLPTSKTHSKTHALDLPTSETLTENHAVHLPASKTHSKTRRLPLTPSQVATASSALIETASATQTRPPTFTATEQATLTLPATETAVTRSMTSTGGSLSRSVVYLVLVARAEADAGYLVHSSEELQQTTNMSSVSVESQRMPTDTLVITATLVGDHFIVSEVFQNPLLSQQPESTTHAPQQQQQQQSKLLTFGPCVAIDFKDALGIEDAVRQVSYSRSLLRLRLSLTHHPSRRVEAEQRLLVRVNGKCLVSTAPQQFEIVVQKMPRKLTDTREGKALEGASTAAAPMVAAATSIAGASPTVSLQASRNSIAISLLECGGFTDLKPIEHPARVASLGPFMDSEVKAQYFNAIVFNVVFLFGVLWLHYMLAYACAENEFPRHRFETVRKQLNQDVQALLPIGKEDNATVTATATAGGNNSNTRKQHQQCDSASAFQKKDKRLVGASIVGFPSRSSLVLLLLCPSVKCAVGLLVNGEGGVLVLVVCIAGLLVWAAYIGHIVYVLLTCRVHIWKKAWTKRQEREKEGRSWEPFIGRTRKKSGGLPADPWEDEDDEEELDEYLRDGEKNKSCCTRTLHYWCHPRTHWRTCARDDELRKFARIVSRQEALAARAERLEQQEEENEEQQAARPGTNKVLGAALVVRKALQRHVTESRAKLVPQRYGAYFEDFVDRNLRWSLLEDVAVAVILAGLEGVAAAKPIYCDLVLYISLATCLLHFAFLVYNMPYSVRYNNAIFVTVTLLQVAMFIGTALGRTTLSSSKSRVVTVLQSIATCAELLVMIKATLDVRNVCVDCYGSCAKEKKREDEYGEEEEDFDREGENCDQDEMEVLVDGSNKFSKQQKVPSSPSLRQTLIVPAIDDAALSQNPLALNNGGQRLEQYTPRVPPPPPPMSASAIGLPINSNVLRLTQTGPPPLQQQQHPMWPTAENTHRDRFDELAEQRSSVPRRNRSAQVALGILERQAAAASGSNWSDRRSTNVAPRLHPDDL